jgi:hypothetical protein
MYFLKEEEKETSYKLLYFNALSIYCSRRNWS